jgi:hypothetical protein
MRWHTRVGSTEVPWEGDNVYNFSDSKNRILFINYLGLMAGAEQSEVSALYIYDNEFNVHLIVIHYPFNEE